MKRNIRLAWPLVRPKKSSPAFLAVEAIVALAIICVAINTTVVCLSGSKTLVEKSSRRCDQALAYHVLKKCQVDRVKVHGHYYQLRGDKKVYDEEENKTYALK